jgi:hypothetical protein
VSTNADIPQFLQIHLNHLTMFSPVAWAANNREVQLHGATGRRGFRSLFLPTDSRCGRPDGSV